MADMRAFLESVRGADVQDRVDRVKRLKQRLLHSQDYQYLSERVLMNYSVESDKLKLLLTIFSS